MLLQHRLTVKRLLSDMMELFKWFWTHRGEYSCNLPVLYSSQWYFWNGKDKLWWKVGNLTRTKVIEEDVIIFVFNAIFMIYLICIFKAFVFSSNLNIWCNTCMFHVSWRECGGSFLALHHYKQIDLLRLRCYS